MKARRAEILLEGLPLARLNWLLEKEKIPIQTLMEPTLVYATRGVMAHDNRFDYKPDRQPAWLAFEEEEDFVFWLPGSYDAITTAEGRAFALGEDNITNAGTYFLDGALTVFADPLSWLKARRCGIVIFDWFQAFDRLRDVPRICTDSEAIAERLDSYMKPLRIPAITFRDRKPRSTGRSGRA
jgi:hypothetical protein